jgi:hypothetical protein
MWVKETRSILPEKTYEIGDSLPTPFSRAI